MFRRRRFEQIPELNTSSTADISFMLLIFFLVTSSMDTDKGLLRQLPPLPQEQTPPTDVRKDHVLQVTLDAHDQLAVDGTPIVNRGTIFSFDDGGSLHLLNSGNEFKVNLKSSSKMHCRVQDTMTYWADVTLEGSSVLDLHGFDQKFGDLVLAGESSRVTSEMPANILAYCDDALIAATNKGVFAGAVSFTKSGARRIVLASENTSTGTLGVQNGPLVIAPGGKWTGKTATIGAEATNRVTILIGKSGVCEGKSTLFRTFPQNSL